MECWAGIAPDAGPVRLRVRKGSTGGGRGRRRDSAGRGRRSRSRSRGGGDGRRQREGGVVARSGVAATVELTAERHGEGVNVGLGVKGREEMGQTECYNGVRSTELS